MLNQWWLVKLGKAITYATGLGACAALVVVHLIDATLATPTFLQGLLWISWAQLLLGFGCAGDRRTLRDLAGVEALVRLRGVAKGAENEAWLLGIVRTLCSPVLIVSGLLALTHCALATAFREVTPRLLAIPVSLLCFLGLGVLLALVAMFLGMRAGKHARLLFLASLLLPTLAFGIWLDFPSIPSVVGWLVGSVASAGAG